MQDLLKTLYRIFYETRGMHDLPPDAEAAYRSLISHERESLPCVPR